MLQLRTALRPTARDMPRRLVPRFDDLVAALDGVPFMTEQQGRSLWAHFARTRPRLVLDVGTCFGASAAYMAGALKALGGGRVVTVDSGQLDHLESAHWCEEVWERCGVRDLIEKVRIPHSSYAWWLMRQLVPDGDGPARRAAFDFAYLDGAKSLTVDTTAVVCLQQLLRPGGWLLMDDLRWSHAAQPSVPPPVLQCGDVTYTCSDDEVETPHLATVWELAVAGSPAFRDTRVDGSWGWAQRVPARRRPSFL